MAYGDAVLTFKAPWVGALGRTAYGVLTQTQKSKKASPMTEPA